MTAGQSLLLQKLQPYKLKKAGPDKWTFLSPLREEKEPSGTLTFDGDNVMLYDFGDTADDARDRMVKVLGLTWPEVLPSRDSPIPKPARHDEKDAQKRTRAAAKAGRLWTAGTRPGTDQPYLQRKGLAPVETLREIDQPAAAAILGYAPKSTKETLTGRLLIVPIKVGDKLSTVELIDGAGHKAALFGGKKTGGYWASGALPEGDGEGLTILIGEGVATCLSGAAATGYLVIAALSCGNLATVGKYIRARYPKAKIILLADLGNGQPKAIEAARAVDGFVATPTFPQGIEGKDANDLHVRCGLEAVRQCIEAATQPAPAQPVAVDAVVVPPSDGRSARDYMCTEMGAAQLFADMNRAHLRYDLERRGWRVWTGSNWRFDVGGVVALERTKGIPEAFLEDARWAVKNDDIRAPILSKFAVHTQKLSVRESILGGAKAEGLAVSSSVFDANGDLVNFSNGTYDTVRDEFREHRREDYNTIVLPYPHDKDATAPLWLKTIGEIWPEQEKQQFVQRWIGYCLCKSVKEQKFVYMWGVGANGKTVVLKIFLRLLGDYAGQCPSDIFAISPNDDRARKILPLKDKRLVITTETQGGQCLDEAMIKSVVSPDTQTSRRLYSEVETWEPTAKVIIAGNHKMRTRGGDCATDRRIIFLGCEQKFEGSKCDPDLIDKLSLELPGIANWAIEGHRQWKAHGLGMPSQIQDDTRDFCEANDTLAPFFDDVCLPDAEAFVFRTSLYRAYAEWSRAEGNEHPLSPRSFADRVQERGFHIGPKRSIGSARDRTWEGLSLRGGEGSGHMGTCGQQSGKLLLVTSLGKEPGNAAQKCPVPSAQGLTPPDPMAQIRHCLRVRPGTSATDADEQALVEHFSRLNGTAEATAQRLWTYWKAALAPTVSGFLAIETKGQTHA
jgi:P4 family phage/plasmid primase-like protien